MPGDNHYPLSAYPYVAVRIGCAYCRRRGSYRLARLAAKFGPETDIYDVLRQLARDCPYNDEFKRGKKLGCGVRYPDLDPPTRPPDVPRTTRPLRVVKD